MRATRTRVAVSLLVLLTSISVLTAQGPLLPPGGALSVLETYLESMRQQAGIPGMSAAVLRDEEIVWERGFGFQNVETRVRIPTERDEPANGRHPSPAAGPYDDLLYLGSQRRSEPNQLSVVGIQ